jgi:hypothetical protein
MEQQRVRQVDPPNVVRRKTESRAMTQAELDHFMQSRIRRFGQPGLTLREYEAVVHGLVRLPEIAFDPDKMNHQHTVELPVQRYIAGKMRISHQRVSQLLRTASNAMQWFDQTGRGAEIFWTGDKLKGWHLTAPIVDTQDRPRISRVRVVKNKRSRSYRLAFAGDL